jgi:hypothetical protein
LVNHMIFINYLYFMERMSKKNRRIALKKTQGGNKTRCGIAPNSESARLPK